MDRLLAKAGWVPVNSPNGGFDLIKKQKALYSLIEDKEAWKDYQFRLTQLRDGTRVAIERGAVDAHGLTHEPEQRAVLYVVEQLLSYVPSITKEYEQMVTALKSDESLANNSLYGDDQMMDLTSIL